MVLGWLMIFCLLPCSVWPDIFVQEPAANTALVEDVSNDRKGYYYHSLGVSLRPVDKKVSDLAALTSGVLTRDQSLEDVDGSFQKEFDESFSKESSFDRYRAASNKLLLLEYSSPALADVIKHYRVMTAQRVGLEQQRLAEIERRVQGPLDRLRSVSERECLHEKQGMGLVKAMEECKKSSQPFDALPLLNGQGSLSDGRRNIHVVRDALALLEFSEKDLVDKVPALCGDVIISDDDYREILAKETFAGRIEYYYQKSIRKWKEVLDQYARGTEISQHMSEISLPGVPVTDVIVKGLLVLNGAAQTGQIAKLSAYWARVQTHKEYGDALLYLDHARRLPNLSVEFRNILSARGDYLKEVMRRAGNREYEIDAYRAMLAGLLNDADIARAGLLADNASQRKEDAVSPESIMVSF